MMEQLTYIYAHLRQQNMISKYDMKPSMFQQVAVERHEQIIKQKP